MKSYLALLSLVGALAFGAQPAVDAAFSDERGGRPRAAQQAASVTFSAAGDHGANASVLASLATLDQSGSQFYLALGDMDYDEVQPDSAWCEYMLAGLPTLGPTFPLQLIVGNHEAQNGEDGYIMNHAACLPDRMGSTGVYAAEYYFDYPSDSPLMRVILIGANTTVENVNYQYTAGSAHYNWLSSAIDDARLAGIPWVVVGMHKVCLTAGIKPCETGKDLPNLLVEKRVDLVLQGHDHNYQRSKQLVHGPACASLATNSYNSECVADDGADGAYAKGAGTAFVIAGTFGRCCTPVSLSDPEAGYFAATGTTSEGFAKVTADEGQMQVQFVPSTGAFTDSFTIVGNGGDGDGDGFTSATELYLGTDPGDPCGEPQAEGFSGSWPADLLVAGIPDTTDKVTIGDLTSFLGPERRMNTNPGHPSYHRRWDLVPGSTVLPVAINIQDLVALLLTAPPMFSGQRAFNGPACTG
jgi:hypothetical protein